MVLKNRAKIYYFSLKVIVVWKRFYVVVLILIFWLVTASNIWKESNCGKYYLNPCCAYTVVETGIYVTGIENLCGCTKYIYFWK